MKISYAKQFRPSIRLGYALFLQEAQTRHGGKKYHLIDEVEKQRLAKLNPLVTIHESYREFLESSWKTEAWKKLCNAQRHVDKYVDTASIDFAQYAILVATIAEVGCEI